MCGWGIRSLRYHVEANADFVVANDANDDNRRIITDNLSKIERGTGDERRWVVTHMLANKAMIEQYMVGDFFDWIDIDSFGSDSAFLRDAFNALKLGGLLYLTSTDGYSSGGHRPYKNYGFVTLRHLCGHSDTVRWDELGLMGCPCSDTKASSSLVVSGPMWLGLLHDASYVTEMLELAKEWGWVSEGTGMDLEKLLSIMIEESDPRLPPGYIKMDEMANRAKMNSHSLKKMISALVKEGYTVSRSHIMSNVLKSDCPMSQFIKIAKDEMQS